MKVAYFAMQLLFVNLRMPKVDHCFATALCQLGEFVGAAPGVVDIAE